MTTCNIHENHDHQHGKGCGHTAIRHNDHIDYVHDGHLHHVHEDHVDEHRLDISDTNPDGCHPVKSCGCEATCTCNPCTENCGCACKGQDHKTHVHGPDCGHEAIPHGDHICYIVNGRLHYPHDGHCDDHGPVEIVS